jgi:hypothetical protein
VTDDRGRIPNSENYREQSRLNHLTVDGEMTVSAKDDQSVEAEKRCDLYLLQKRSEKKVV